MADASFLQTSFLGGLWGAFFQGRADHPDYKRALSECLNSYALEEGCWVRRAGFRHAGMTRNGQTAIVRPFTLINSKSYNVELTDRMIRFHSDVDLVTKSSATVILFSTAKPLGITAALTGITTGDQVIFTPNSTHYAALCPLLLHRQFKAIVVGAGMFNLYDPITGEAIDGSLYGGAVSGSWKVAKVNEIPTPYYEEALPDVRMIQSETQAVFLAPGYAPRVLTQADLDAPTGYHDFGFAVADLQDGPYLDPVNNLAVTDGTTGTVTFTLQETSGFAGFKTTDVGRHIRIYSQPKNWDASATQNPGDVRLYDNIAYSCIFATSFSSGLPPPTQPTAWAIAPLGQLWTWGVITEFVSSLAVKVQIRGADLLYSSPVQVQTWRIGLYGEATGYPTVGCYHDGRLWLAGAAPNRIDSSNSNQLFYMAPTDQSGAVGDANAISAIFNSSDDNEIVWLMPDLQGIIAGSLGGEWLIQGAGGQGLYPSTIQARRITKYGCAPIEPRRTGLTTVFVQKFKRRLFEYLSDVFSGKFFAPNLSERAKNILVNDVAELAYQEELSPIVWVRDTAGALSGLTYRRISMFSTQPPEFSGWHRHTLGSGRVIESFCVGPSADGLLDTLTLVTNDPSTGIRHLELAGRFFDEGATRMQAWFLDNAIIPYFGTSSGSGVTFYGLAHLEGSRVTAFIAGLDCGEYLVSGGAITVPYLSDPDKAFTCAYMASVSTAGPTDFLTPIDEGMLTIPAVIGFTYTSQGQLLRPLAPQETGARNGPSLGKTRRLHQAAFYVHKTMGLSVGTSFDKLRPAIFKTPGGTVYGNDALFSGIHWTTIDDDNSFDGKLCWQATRPLPATMLAIEGFLHTQDR